MVMTTFNIEWVLRITLLAVSVYQYKTVNSKVGEYCVHRELLLALEGLWLSTLIKL